MPLAAALPVGSYVRLETDDRINLGELLGRSIGSTASGGSQAVIGSGNLLVRPDGTESHPLDDGLTFGHERCHLPTPARSPDRSTIVGSPWPV